jgi:type IV pilus assembly protein PilA
MLTRINKHRDEAGFTLIELLVVVIIIGILAAIAIPVFLNQRNSARLASVQSDLRNAAIQVETEYTQTQEWPTALPATITPSSGNTIAYVYDGDGTYTISGCNAEALQGYTYDSAAGGLADADAATCAIAADGSLSFPTA